MTATGKSKRLKPAVIWWCNFDPQPCRGKVSVLQANRHTLLDELLVSHPYACALLRVAVCAALVSPA